MKAWLLRSLGLTGTLLFGSLFVLTFYRPAWVERAAKDFITTQVEEQVGTHVAAAAGAHGGVLAQAARELYEGNTARIDELEFALRSKLHDRIAAALAQVRNLDCECRTRVATLLEAGMVTALGSLESENSRLTEFIHGSYLRVVDELTRDLRIFAATNALACLLLLVVSFARPGAIDHLLFPGLLLGTAVLVASSCYVFGQNWFFTILYSDYFGFSYLAFVGCVFGLLLDVFLNRGRVTTQLGNGLLHVVGSTFSLSIC
jgi:hypothetical protein